MLQDRKLVDFDRVLSRFVAPAFVWTGQREKEIHASGTCFLSHRDGEYFAITSAHQFGGRKEILLDDSCNLYLSSHKNESVSSEGCYLYDLKDSESEMAFHDLVIFRMTKCVESGALNSANFMSFDRKSCLIGPHRVVTGVCYGFPAANVMYGLTDDPEGWVTFADSTHSSVRIQSNFSGNSYLKDDSLLHWRQTDRLEIQDLDGMSGSPQFAVTIDERGMRPLFAGIVLQGGNHNIHVVSPDCVDKLISDYVSYLGSEIS